MPPYKICQYHSVDDMRIGVNEAHEQGYRVDQVVTHEENEKKYSQRDDAMVKRKFRVWTVFLRKVV